MSSSGHGFAFERDDLGPTGDLAVVDDTHDVAAWNHAVD